MMSGGSPESAAAPLGWTAPERPRRALLWEGRSRIRSGVDVLVDAARERRIERSSATDRGTEIQDVRGRPVRPTAESPGLAVNHRPVVAVCPHFHGEAPALVPADAPEIPPRAVEAALSASAIARHAVPGNHAAADRTRAAAVILPAQFTREAVTVRRDVVEPLLHREDLALVALAPFVGALDHQRELAGRQRDGQLIGDVTVVPEQLQPFTRELRGSDDRADGPSTAQGIEELVVANESAERRLECRISGPWTKGSLIRAAGAPRVGRVWWQHHRGGMLHVVGAAATAADDARVVDDVAAAANLELIRNGHRCELHLRLRRDKHQRVGLLAVGRGDRGWGRRFQRRSVRRCCAVGWRRRRWTGGTI